jgi:PLP dependent protein
MPGLIHGIEAERVAANLERIRERAGEDVEILAASKYVPHDEMGALADGGVVLVGENRQQDLEAKQELWGDRFTWDFIGNLQSRKVPRLLGRVRLIHSVSSDSVLERLARHTDEIGGTEILVQVNVAREDGKGGVAVEELDDFIARCPVPVGGLSTMPPFTEDPEQSRPYFARLAELAGERGLKRLSMGTTQDWPVAVSEGATIIRVGTALFM